MIFFSIKSLLGIQMC